MKGLNVKKLAAAAAGVALLGAAVAPIASAATNVVKDDIYGPDGSPKVNIVIGSTAALSDAQAAGNLGVKIAEKAAMKKDVSVSATGEDGEAGTADLDLTDLTVDVTVGGSVTFGAGSKEFKVTLNSNSGTTNEVQTSNDTNALTDAQLPHLYNASKSQKVNNGDQSNITSNATITEKIGVNVDAKFSQSTDVKDLVGLIGSNNFYYELVISSGNGIDLGSTSFTDGADDNVKLTWFGEEYELSTASLTGTKNLKLVKSSAKESYNEGETIEGLIGDNVYDGQDVTVKVVQIVQAGAAAATYSATFELYDSEGNLIDTQTVAQDANLRDSFKDDDGNEALLSNLFVNTIAVGSTTGVGYVEITKGTDTLLLFDGKGYPYDATDTSSSYKYKVQITAGSSDANALGRVKVYNDRDTWDIGSSNGPLYPTKSGQSLTGKAGVTSTFGQALPDGTLGKGYAKVDFLGFENKEEKTLIKIGKHTDVTDNLDSQAITFGGGGIQFKDSSDNTHNLPFAIMLPSTLPTGNSRNSGSFVFDTKTTYWDQNFGPSSNAADVNFYVVSGDYVNGRLWTLTNISTNGVGDGNLQILVQGIGDINGGAVSVTENIGFRDKNLTTNDTFVVEGTTFTVRDHNVNAGSANASIGVDGELIFTKSAAYDPANVNTSNFLFNTGGDTTDQSYGKLYFSQNVTFDGNVQSGSAAGVPVTVPLLGVADKKFYYAVHPATAFNKLWILMDADRLGSDDSSLVQNSKVIDFLGTNLPVSTGTAEVKGIGNNADGNRFILGQGLDQHYIPNSGGQIWYGRYIPHDADYNSNAMFSNTNDYFVAEFRIQDNVSGGVVGNTDINVYVNTDNGGNLGTFSNNNLSSYATNADFNGSPTISLTNGSNSSYLQSAYTDAGTKLWLEGNDGVNISAPETAEKVQVFVYGAETTREVAGGEDLTGLAVGDEGITDAGTKVTIKAVNGGSCTLGEGTSNVLCSATPEEFWAPAAVQNPLIFLDVEAPSGPNIVIGGHIVNRLASSLADRLTEPGQMVAEVDAATGDIYLAGYTAADTGRAVQELIEDIDSWEEA